MSGDKPWDEWAALSDWPLCEESGVETDLPFESTWGTGVTTALAIGDVADRIA